MPISLTRCDTNLVLQAASSTQHQAHVTITATISDANVTTQQINDALQSSMQNVSVTTEDPSDQVVSFTATGYFDVYDSNDAVSDTAIDAKFNVAWSMPPAGFASNNSRGTTTYNLPTGPASGIMQLTTVTRDNAEGTGVIKLDGIIQSGLPLTIGVNGHASVQWAEDTDPDYNIEYVIQQVLR